MYREQHGEYAYWYALIAKRDELVKQKDDQVTFSENTFAT